MNSKISMIAAMMLVLAAVASLPAASAATTRCNDTACVEADTDRWLVNYNTYCPSTGFPCWAGEISATSSAPSPLVTTGGYTEVKGHLFGFPLFDSTVTFMTGGTASDSVVGVHGATGTLNCIEADALFRPNIGSQITAYESDSC